LLITGGGCVFINGGAGGWLSISGEHSSASTGLLPGEAIRVTTQVTGQAMSGSGSSCCCIMGIAVVYSDGTLRKINRDDFRSWIGL
jgi:hypothetical protein